MKVVININGSFLVDSYTIAPLFGALLQTTPVEQSYNQMTRLYEYTPVKDTRMNVEFIINEQIKLNPKSPEEQTLTTSAVEIQKPDINF